MSQGEPSGPDLDGVVADANAAIEVEIGGAQAHVAGLRSLVGFKRLADRPQDRVDLEALERVNGELPVDPLPGLDV